MNDSPSTRSRSPLESPAYSRRRFISRLAQGTVALGGAAAVSPVAAGGNPFAYDVSRLSRTDPALIGWEEVSRRSCGRAARRLAIGPDDCVHLAAGNEVLRWTPTGSAPAFSAGATVHCLAVASDATVFAGLRNRIVAFDPEGRPKTVWQSEDPRSWFSGLAVSESGFWVADSGARLIWRCDRAGTLRGRIGQRDDARNRPGLVVPSPFLDVRLHRDGRLRVNNPGRHRVEAYTIDGDFELAWGRPGAAIDGFCGCCNPIALALLPDGRIVTAEKGLPRVKVFGADGTFQAVVAGSETFADNRRRSAESGDSLRAGLDVATDAAGRIHILDRATGEVRVMRAKARA